MMHEFSVKTSRKEEMVNITRQVQDFVRQAGVQEGECTVYVPHTTAGITINEGADPDVCRDILMALQKMVSEDWPYRHLEGNSTAHIKASLMGNSVTVLIHQGKLQLGTWQAIFFCEFDGPRHRHAWLKIRPHTS
ncbi:MAG: YjbQ family protein [Calditrichaeota bacterium]|nr:MAG: YjbQ family protein [Calditrichota bacterium]